MSYPRGRLLLIKKKRKGFEHQSSFGPSSYFVVTGFINKKKLVGLFNKKEDFIIKSVQPFLFM